MTPARDFIPSGDQFPEPHMERYENPWRDTDIGFVHETEPGAAFDTSDAFDEDEPLALWVGLRNALLITAACVMTGCGLWGVLS